MRFLFLTLLSGAVFFAFPAFSACAACGTEVPSRVDISYSVTSGSLEADMNDTLKITQENGERRYSLYSEGKAKGLLALTQPDTLVRDSEGIITTQGMLRPERFSDQHGNKVPKVAIFDWGKKLITLQHKRGEEQKVLPADAQDKLSLLYSFMFTSAPGKMVNLHETDGKHLEPVCYAVSKETLDTPMGKLKTIVLTKQLGKEGDRDKKIWLAVDHHMLPVRVVATEKIGIVTDQMVTKISYGESMNGIKQGRLQ
ncbi:uncharacterized protein DUF3108 [Nitrosospira multiformis]|jgi:hypothetical protein|uniref:Uncharacterized protein DUF3108 n=1 Tax=Nitrosospira multiformis TaxID=1231 RepID=A0A2T5I7D4_9PROT|nr:DUF3108 domain-containing protein [Nitrosospira multiformis]PTQ79734.1 uncharacterized protein DUF3108 [Nitrosospira multiformis]